MNIMNEHLFNLIDIIVALSLGYALHYITIEYKCFTAKRGKHGRYDF